MAGKNREFTTLPWMLRLRGQVEMSLAKKKALRAP
jgi:hypothetical protein